MEQDSILPIIKATLSTDVDHLSVVFQELDGCPYILDNERSWIEYIKHTIQSTHIAPTEQLLEIKFPQIKQLNLDSVESLSVESLNVYLRQFIKSRQDRFFSQSLMEISYEVSKGGLTDELQDKAFKLVTATRTNQKEEGYSNPFDTFIQEYKERKLKPKGLKTYIQSLDEEIGGMNVGTVNTIMGFVGSFKTTFAMNIVYNNIVHEGYKVCVVSLEMTKNELLNNLVARHSYDQKFNKKPFISSKKIRNTSLSDEEEDVIFNEVFLDFSQYKDNLHILDQSDFTTFSELEFEYQFDLADQALNGMDAFIVDHIGLLKYAGEQSRRNEFEVMNAYMRFFQGQTVNFLHRGRQVTSIILAQANRDGYLRAIRNDGNYDLRAISEANEIERSSYRVFSVFTDENLKLSKELKVGLIKHRGGSTLSAPVSCFCEPDAGVIGDVTGFHSMPSAQEFADVFDFSVL